MNVIVGEKHNMSINQLLCMQIRILTMFCDRHNISINKASKIFEENEIFSLIEYGWDGYHCGSDEIVYEDMENILKIKGVIV